jgi:alkylation response protein AidB-like acyl-CoA dehydrogenase
MTVPGDDELDAFRVKVRAWAEDHVPTGWEDQFGASADAEYIEFQRGWLRELRDGGYAAPHWSEEWGGGYSLSEQVVIFEELSRLNAPRLRNFFVALHHAYATLTHAGTEEQRQRHLPAILNGDEVWCQGFSEPGAGSDLAGLRTRAVRDGGYYIVNGQKVWSSGAMHAGWCLLLARTDPAAPKRRGISYFLVDMRTPGIEVRPIRQATGAAEFCEIFFTDVAIPVENRIGAENDGWRIAQTTLTTERGVTILQLAERLAMAMEWLVDLARESRIGGRPAIEDPAVREELVTRQTEVDVLRRLCRKMIADIERRGGTGPEASIIKIFYSELLQRLMASGVSLAGLATHRDGIKPVSAGWESGNWMLDYVDSWGWITGGGTNEIQHTLVGERVLGLPREPGTQ